MINGFRISLLLFLNFFFSGKSQHYFLRPVIEKKNCLTQFRSETYSTGAFDVRPYRWVPLSFSPIHVGLFAGCEFHKGNTIEFGVVQDSPQIGYEVRMTSYNLNDHLYDANSVQSTTTYHIFKCPLLYSFKPKQLYSGSKGLGLQGKLLIGLALLMVRDNAHLGIIQFGRIQTDTNSFLSVESTAGAIASRSLLYGIGYNLEFRTKKHRLFSLRVYAEIGFRKILQQSIFVSYQTPVAVMGYRFTQSASASGISLQLTKQLNFRPTKRQQIKRQAVTN